VDRFPPGLDTRAILSVFVRRLSPALRLRRAAENIISENGERGLRLLVFLVRPEAYFCCILDFIRCSAKHTAFGFSFFAEIFIIVMDLDLP